jgi:hypothetical protein
VHQGIEMRRLKGTIMREIVMKHSVIEIGHQRRTGSRWDGGSGRKSAEGLISASSSECRVGDVSPVRASASRRRAGADAMAALSSFARPSGFGKAPTRLHRRIDDTMNQIDLEQSARMAGSYGFVARTMSSVCLGQVCTQILPNERHGLDWSS